MDPFVQYFFFVLVMLALRGIKVDIFWIQGLFVNDLSEFRANIFYPIRNLSTCPMVPQSFDIDSAGHER
ncbi:hypothetical protein WS95_17640 [Burkholderia sp. MSMB1826]|nr:hypothetical protein WS95_17640 [Burkholderia sp. MSMB1826]